MNVLLLPSTAFNNHTAVISDSAQLRHIQHVLSPQIGDRLKIGELGGNLGVATVAKLDVNHCVLTDVALDKSPPAKLDLTVIVALPRPKVLRRLVLDMTAMGVGHIIFINSYRTDKCYWGSPLLTRLDEFVQDGLQQGVDSVPPKISLAKRFKPFVQDELPSLITTPHSALVAHPYAPVHFNEQISKQGLIHAHGKKGFCDQGRTAEDKGIDPSKIRGYFPKSHKQNKKKCPCSQDNVFFFFLPCKILFLLSGNFRHFH